MSCFQHRSAIGAILTGAGAKLKFLFAAAALAALMGFPPSLSGAENVPTAAAVANSQQSGKKRMGVPAFANSSSTKDGDYGERFADMLLSELIQNRNYELIERTMIAKVLAEQRLGMTGIVDQSQVAKVGKIMALDYMVLGNILEASAINKGGTESAAISILSKGKTNVPLYRTELRVVVNLKVIKVETGEIVFSDNAEDTETITWADRPERITPERYFGSARKAIAKAAFKIIREIAPQEPAVILVKKVKDKITEVVIDMGRENGIREDQHFAIVREGQPLYGRNDEIIGVDIIEIAHVTVVRAEATTATAKVVKINNNPEAKGTYEIVRGDLLRPQDKSKVRSLTDIFAK